jgi:nitrous oxidase accessory protein
MRSRSPNPVNGSFFPIPFLRTPMNRLSTPDPFYRLVLFLLIGLVLVVQSGFSATLTVSPGGRTSSIREAIEQARPHDRIVIRQGIYCENEILIDKPLTLTGEPGAVLDARFKGGVFTVHANDVTIEGLTIRNVEVSHLQDNAAIRLVQSKRCTLRNNRIENSFFGIYLEKSDSCLVQQNVITGQAKEETSSGNAIHLWTCQSITIDRNQATGHRDGIYLEFVKNSRVTGNLSRNNVRYGLHFMFSDNNEYRGNRFARNGSGVAVMYSQHIHMYGNHFEENWGTAAYGMLLKDITDSHIERNHFTKNTIGLHVEGSNRIGILHNEFHNNGWAVRLMGSCDGLEFLRNNFISNTFEVGTSSHYQAHNRFEGNYWSSYAGYDLDRDGQGDVPHKPVKLSSYLMERNPTSLVLLRSMFLDLVELAEKVTPALTPVHLADERPAMREIGEKE